MSYPRLGYLSIKPDGGLTIHEGDPYGNYGDTLDQLVGGQGRNRVQLHRNYPLAGWVSDVGHSHPDRYPRNVVGSCLLASLGAAQQPYAGTIVITGWNADNTARDLVEVEPIDAVQIGKLASMFAAVQSALSSPNAPTPQGYPARWGSELRQFAELVRISDAPIMRLVSKEELMNWLGGRG